MKLGNSVIKGYASDAWGSRFKPFLGTIFLSLLFAKWVGVGVAKTYVKFMVKCRIGIAMKIAHCAVWFLESIILRNFQTLFFA